MSKPKLKCRQCEERLGEDYQPKFESLSRLYNSVDEDGTFLDEIGIVLEEYYCANCGQTLASN